MWVAIIHEPYEKGIFYFDTEKEAREFYHSTCEDIVGTKVVIDLAEIKESSKK